MISLGRREVLQGAAATVLASLAWKVSAQSVTAREVYDRALVIDGLAGPGGFDPAYKDGDPLLPGFIAEAKASGVTAANVTVSAVGNGQGKYEETIKNIAFAERELGLHPDLFMKIRTANDLKTAKAAGRLGLIYGFQDTSMLEGDLGRLEQFHNVGVRIIQPVYNRRNLMGDGCLEPNNGGLSTLGRELIGELNDRRILVDMSHAGSRTQAEAIALSKKPCAITHSGCRAIADLPRNTRDEELKALAVRGGVMGIYFMPFLRTKGQPMAEDVIRHIEHAVKVAGEDHVGLGTDGLIGQVSHIKEYRELLKKFVEGRRKLGIASPGEDPDVVNFIPDYNFPRRFERLADDLLKRGHSTTRVEKILGGNFARLFGEVWG